MPTFFKTFVLKKKTLKSDQLTSPDSAWSLSNFWLQKVGGILGTKNQSHYLFARKLVALNAKTLKQTIFWRFRERLVV